MCGGGGRVEGLCGLKHPLPFSHPPTHPTHPTPQVRTNMQRGLATRLHDLSVACRKDQKQYIGTSTKIRKGPSLQELFGSQRECVEGGGGWV